MKSKDELIDQMVSEMPFVFNEKMRPYIKELMGIWGMLIIYGNAQQPQPSGMSAEEVKEIAENHFKNTTWLEGTQEQDTKFGFRIGYMKAMKDFAIQNPSTASPAGAAEGASEGMAEALAKFFAKECKVGDPLLPIIDSIYDDWKLVYDKLRIETSFSEAAIQANKFVIEKYASLSPGVEDNQTKKQ